MPIVLVDSTALPEHGSIEVDDVGGARAAAEYILGLGHRDVLVIGVEPPAPTSVARTRTASPAGGCAAIARRSPPSGRRSTTTESWSVPPASMAASRSSTRAWEDGLRPTAVLAMCDAMAIGAMRALRDLRLDVPGDVSVVGFDDIDLAPHVDPPLTTVHQPIRRKGEEAVRLLLSVVERRDLAKPEHRRLETRLIVRASTGPVRRTGRRWPDTETEIGSASDNPEFGAARQPRTYRSDQSTGAHRLEYRIGTMGRPR